MTATSGGTAVPAGGTIDPAAGLTLTWSPATDGSGVSGYGMRWTSQVTDTLVADTEAYLLAGRPAHLFLHCR